jgi:protein-disulfide reductase (glutathione)
MQSVTNWMRHRRVTVAIAALLCGIVLAGKARAAIEDWNDANIKWMSYDEGLAAAKKSHKPICLIFFTTWCPHCKNYSGVFSDPAVVKKAQSFVMIRLDKDKNAELSKKYAPDGEYIPRTYFLSSDGTLDPALSETRDQYKYFYNEKDPASILAGMDRALKKLQ